MSHIFHNHAGTPMKIVDIQDATHVMIEFQDEYMAKVKTVYEAVVKGNVKNPYERKIFGIGYLGEGNIQTHNTPEYQNWFEIMARCYDERLKEKNSAYFGIVTVCEEWHNFSNFGKWYRENKYKVDGRLHIDKDIKIHGNKIYSPNTCILIPQRINMMFMNKENKRGLPTGIYEVKNGFQARYNTVNLGTYDSIEKAYSVYASAKENAIKKVAQEYKGIIPDSTYEILINYKVMIDDDKNYNPIRRWNFGYT